MVKFGIVLVLIKTVNVFYQATQNNHNTNNYKTKTHQNLPQGTRKILKQR